VPYQSDIAAALEAAKTQEFTAGRYRLFDPDDAPATIEEACQQAAESGTCSVLDMTGVADEPLADDVGNWMATGDLPASFCMAAPLSLDQLQRLYGTDRPTHRQVEANHEFYEWIDRGLGIYVVVYDDLRKQPVEIFFAGYSFD
jgi:hypothetical protein